MPPPEEEKPPLSRPNPPKPKPKPKTGPEPKPRPDFEHYWTPGGGAGTIPPDPIACAGSCSGACALLPHCSQPQSPSFPAATVHISSSRLSTPLIALSASLLAVSAVLLLALLVHRLARRRQRRRMLAAHHDAEQGGQVFAGGGAAAGGEEEEADGGGVHHVWYIRTKGLDERAIAAIAAVVYDAGSKRRGCAGGADDDDGSCAVCLAEFRHGETLRLLPRCGHAFHRGCIDTWLRAHVNCPLCRAPVQVAADPDTAPAAATPAGAPERNPRAVGGVQIEETALPAERGVRRAASMVALPRRAGAWPDASFRAPASSSGREGDMTGGLGKILRLLKFSDSLETAASGQGGQFRSAPGAASACRRQGPGRRPPALAPMRCHSELIDAGDVNDDAIGEKTKSCSSWIFVFSLLSLCAAREGKSVTFS